MKCFDLLTGKLAIRRTVKVVPYPDRIIRLANSWGKQSRSKQFGNKLEFLDRNKVRYDWDNEEIEEEEALVEPPRTAAHPGILAEIPGVVMESDGEVDTAAIEAAPVPDRAARAAAARANDNFAAIPRAPVNEIRGVIKKKKTPVIMIDNDSDNDNNGYDTDDIKLMGMSKLVNS